MLNSAFFRIAMHRIVLLICFNFKTQTSAIFLKLQPSTKNAAGQDQKTEIKINREISSAVNIQDCISIMNHIY